MCPCVCGGRLYLIKQIDSRPSAHHQCGRDLNCARSRFGPDPPLSSAPVRCLSMEECTKGAQVLQTAHERVSLPRSVIRASVFKCVLYGRVLAALVLSICSSRNCAPDPPEETLSCSCVFISLRFASCGPASWCLSEWSWPARQGYR